MWETCAVVDTLQFVDNLSWLKGSHSFRFGTNMRFQRHTDTRGSVGGANVAPTANFSTAVTNVVDPRPSGSRRTFNSRSTARPSSRTSTSCSDVSAASLRGSSSRGTRTVPGGTLFDFKADYPEIDFYAQDTWKPRSNVTVDLGLR